MPFKHQIQDASKALGWIGHQLPESEDPPSGAVAAVRMVTERLDQIREEETDPGMQGTKKNLSAVPFIPAVSTAGEETAAS